MGSIGSGGIRGAPLLAQLAQAERMLLLLLLRDRAAPADSELRAQDIDAQQVPAVAHVLKSRASHSLGNSSTRFPTLSPPPGSPQVQPVTALRCIRGFDQSLGFKACQETLDLLAKLTGRVLELCFQLSDDVCLVAAAVNQFPDGRRGAVQDHRLGCIQVEQGNPARRFGANFCHQTAALPDHDQ